MMTGFKRPFRLSRMRVCQYFVLLLVMLTQAGMADQRFTTVRVASISFEPVKLDLAGNTETLESWFRHAADGGAQLAVAPEGILDGYIVNEIIAREIPADRMRDVAVAIDSPTIRRFQQLARELRMCLVFGFAERIGEDVFNTAVFIDSAGDICGKYHKMQFAEGYDDTWWFNRPGSTSRAFNTPFGRCGVLICNDRWNPRLAKIPALDGAQFLVIPSFGSTSKSQDEAVLARGIETGLPVVEANVGVSLIVSDDRVATVRRQKQGITFGEIRIPADRMADPEARDRAEAEFLQWREKEMSVRLAKAIRRLDPRGPARDEDVAVLKTSELEVVIGNNRSLETDDVQHRAGYNGVFAIRARQQAESPFVPAYAGINLEHYFDGRPRSESHVFFEPRHAKMNLTKINERTAELHQPATPVFGVESWTRFEVKERHSIDFSFRCRPHRNDYVGGFLGVFWASYINAPLNKSMYFIDAESSLEHPMWKQLCTQLHNRDSTVRHASEAVELMFQGRETLFANDSPLRYSTPFFYGRFRNMVLIYVFRPGAGLRFTHSPSGGGRTTNGDDTNPAWDFQLIVTDPQPGEEYRLEGRLIYKEWTNRDDVLSEVSEYLSKTPDP